jgi:hypothetical protein
MADATNNPRASRSTFGGTRQRDTLADVLDRRFRLNVNAFSRGKTFGSLADAQNAYIDVLRPVHNTSQRLMGNRKLPFAKHLPLLSAIGYVAVPAESVASFAKVARAGYATTRPSGSQLDAVLCQFMQSEMTWLTDALPEAGDTFLRDVSAYHVGLVKVFDAERPENGLADLSAIERIVGDNANVNFFRRNWDEVLEPLAAAMGNGKDGMGVRPFAGAALTAARRKASVTGGAAVPSMGGVLGTLCAAGQVAIKQDRIPLTAEENGKFAIGENEGLAEYSGRLSPQVQNAEGGPQLFDSAAKSGFAIVSAQTADQISELTTAMEAHAERHPPVIDPNAKKPGRRSKAVKPQETDGEIEGGPDEIDM